MRLHGLPQPSLGRKPKLEATEKEDHTQKDSRVSSVDGRASLGDLDSEINIESKRHCLHAGSASNLFNELRSDTERQIILILRILHN